MVYPRFDEVTAAQRFLPLHQMSNYTIAHCVCTGLATCIGGWVPIATAAYLAQVSVTRIKFLVAERKLSFCLVQGVKCVCTGSLKKYIAGRKMRGYP